MVEGTVDDSSSGQMMAKVMRRAMGRCAPANHGGSVVLFALFVCVATALCVQIVSAVLLCGQRALAEEESGRHLVATRDEGIVALQGEALALWGQRPWLELTQEGLETKGRLVQVEGGEGWLLEAEVIQDKAVTSLGTSVWLERGRDGIDLPSAALVAAKVSAHPERSVPWLTRGEAPDGADSLEGSRPEAKGYLTQLPESAHVGHGCSLVEIDETWELDEGWRDLLDSGCRLRAGVYVLVGAEGHTFVLPEDLPATAVDSPVLVVVTGGADLDARGTGSIHGVLVVDGGSVLLEGTIVRGAVFASGEVRFGLTGQVELCGGVLRWATDRSLERVRVVPGTRRESTE